MSEATFKTMGLTRYVNHGDGAVSRIPHPGMVRDGLIYRICYTDPPKEERVQAGMVIATFEFLLGPDCTAAEACRRLRSLRRVYAEGESQ